MDERDDTSAMLGSDKDLAATVRDHWGQCPDPSLPDAVRMPLAVLLTLKRRVQVAGEASDPLLPAVFVMCDYPRKATIDFTTERAPLFSNGTSQLLGRIWFTNCNLTTGYFLEPDGEDIDAWLRCLEQVNQYASCAAVVVDPRCDPWDFRYYPNGVIDEGTCYTYEVKNDEVSVQTLDFVLSRFHSSHIETPECAGPKIWEDSANFVPVRQPERNIQHDLLIYLSATFSGCMVRPEETSKAGRADLVLWERRDEGYISRAILELKVLRSKWGSRALASAYSNVRAVVSAVRQAVAYKDKLGCAIGFACIYDLQKENRASEVMNLAARVSCANQVEIRRWFCFHSSEAWRNNKYP